MKGDDQDAGAPRDGTAGFDFPGGGSQGKEAGGWQPVIEEG